MITVTNEKKAIDKIVETMRRLRPSRRWCYSLDALCLSIKERFYAIGSPYDREVGDCIIVELDRFPRIVVELRIDEKEEPICDEDGNIEDFLGHWVFTAVSFLCDEDRLYEIFDYPPNI